jgi:hypothetical protein
MKIVAVPILESKDMSWATKRIIELYKRTKVRVHLINVQPAYPAHISRFFTAEFLQRIHLEDGRRFLAPMIQALDMAGVPHWDHVLVGPKFERIVEFVSAHYCSEVILRDEPRSLRAQLSFASPDSRIRKALRALYH